MLNQSPIFLGGQGGLVGPCRLEFGTIIAAGSICRKDQFQTGQLVFEKPGKSGNIPFIRGMYPGINRIVINNIVYIANLAALRQWYSQVRSQFISNEFPKGLLESLNEKLLLAMDERIKRLKAFSEKMPNSVTTYHTVAKKHDSSQIIQQQREFYEKWTELEEYFESLGKVTVKEAARDAFLEKIHSGISKAGKDYISVIRDLNREDKEQGSQWLQAIVDHITTGALKIIPTFKNSK